MKRISSGFFLLLVCAGLFFTHPLSAQQYHDAAAFGLEGNVKECKAFNAKDGSGASDPYNFSELSFKRDGQLEFFTETSAYKKKRVYNHYRSNGMLTSFECDFDTEDSLYCRRFNFRYKGNQLFGYYCFSEEYHLKDNSYVPKEYAWGNAYYYKGDNSFTAKYFKILARNPHGLIYILEDEFAKGDDFLPNFQSTHPGRLRSETTNYVIAERDSHGNCTLLTNTDSGYSIKRFITYWDDTPNSDSHSGDGHSHSGNSISDRCSLCQGSGKCSPRSYSNRKSACSGSGLCGYCNGAGWIGSGDNRAVCTACNGDKKCKTCHGTGKCQQCNGTGRK